MDNKNFILYHNNRCSKSRECLKIIRSKGIAFKENNYLRDGLLLQDLKKIIVNLVNPLGELIRKNEKEFKLNSFDTTNKKLIVSFLHKNPKCMQRPIFFNGENYIICRPPEIVLNYL